MAIMEQAQYQTFVVAELEQAMKTLKIGEWMKRMGFSPGRFILYLPTPAKTSLGPIELMPDYVRFVDWALEPLFAVRHWEGRA